MFKSKCSQHGCVGNLLDTAPDLCPICNNPLLPGDVTEDEALPVSHAQLVPEDQDRVAAEQDAAPGGLDTPAEDASPDNQP